MAKKRNKLIIKLFWWNLYSNMELPIFFFTAVSCRGCKSVQKSRNRKLTMEKKFFYCENAAASDAAMIFLAYCPWLWHWTLVFVIFPKADVFPAVILVLRITHLWHNHRRRMAATNQTMRHPLPFILYALTFSIFRSVWESTSAIFS